MAVACGKSVFTTTYQPHIRTIQCQRTYFISKSQAVLDYISGMTDVYALDLYRKIKGNSLPAV